MTDIGQGAFSGCVNLSAVSFNAPSILNIIGPGAFRYCLSLSSITIPASVKDIEYLAFNECRYLRSITLQNGLSSISQSAFSFCKSLSSITIPASIKVLGGTSGGVFNNCTSLSTINILAMVAPPINNNTFNGVPATEVHVPVGATGYGTTYGGLSVIYDL